MAPGRGAALWGCWGRWWQHASSPAQEAGEKASGVEQPLKICRQKEEEVQGIGLACRSAFWLPISDCNGVGHFLHDFLARAVSIGLFKSSQHASQPPLQLPATSILFIPFWLF